MKAINSIFESLSTIYKNRQILYTLVIRDFKNRYLSSFIGLPWAFIQPAVYIMVIWFAFTIGLRVGNTLEGYPYAAWLISGLIPWIFISQTMIVSCNSIIEYSYLIKKTSFPISLIPIIKIFSGLIVHAAIIIFVALLLVFGYRIYPTIYWIQIIYYIFAIIVLLTGISLFVASVNIFLKDTTHMINVLVSMLFWATPILWPYAMLTGNLKYIALLNPFFYITEGYRYTFIQNTWFFEYKEMNLYFWTVTALIFFTGIYTFNKLKPDIGDEL